MIPWIRIFWLLAAAIAIINSHVRRIADRTKMPVGDKKRAYGQKLVDFVENYKSIFIVECDNVRARSELTRAPFHV